jgi:HlyD family secretion protein
MFRDTSAQDRVIAKPPLSRGRKLTLALGALALLLAVVFAAPAVSRWLSASHSVSGERLRTAEVKRGTLIRDVDVPGRVVAAVSPTLFAPAAGSVSLVVKAGDEVTRDQVLATIASPELENTLKQEQAQLATLDVEVRRQRIETRRAQLSAQKLIDEARVTLDAAEREMQRADIAFEKGAISKVDWLKAGDVQKNARIGFTHAEKEAGLEVESLRFEQETRELALERQRLKVEEIARVVDGLTVRAPVAGMVGAVAVTEKAAVAANAPLLTVVDLTRLEVEVQIPETYADDIGIGMNAEVRVGNESIAATVSAISPEIANGQALGRVRFSAGQPASLRQNQRVNARIVMEEKADVLMVARGPFVDTGAGRVAYVLEDGLATRRAIAIGATSIAEVEILSGLVAGERIVISAIDGFENQQRVIVTD